jgi:hypothetical protein
VQRPHRVRYWLWLPDDAPSAACVRGVLECVGFDELQTLERYRVYGPWRWQELTRDCIVHSCEEVRHYVEPHGASLVDVRVLEHWPPRRRYPRFWSLDAATPPCTARERRRRLGARKELARAARVRCTDDDLAWRP